MRHGDHGTNLNMFRSGNDQPLSFKGSVRRTATYMKWEDLFLLTSLKAASAHTTLK